MSAGGRPPGEPPARVDVYLEDVHLGSAQVPTGFRPYSFAIPPEVAAAMARKEDPGRLRILTNTWNPQEALGVPDNRDLGVMVDRVEVR
jgi:hypothetical protein